MTTSNSHIEINRQAWNSRVDIHLHSDFYAQSEFLKGQSSLKPIELDLLGNINDKKILHLQCHFGQDSISMARMGAKVVGIDLSDKAVEKANEIAAQLQANAQFICCDVYAVPQHIRETFDIVFSSYGVIGWLPDLDRWGGVISRMLRPGGRFVFAEFHPVVWMYDNDFRTIAYDYFNRGPMVETESGTYADRQATITQQYVYWNHSLSDVINSLIRNGLQLELLNEYDYSPHNCFQHTEEFEPAKFRIAHIGNKIPMVFALRAIK